MSDLRPPSLPLQLLEGRMGLEAASLLAQLPMLRMTSPRGAGPVMVLPGFMTSDQATWVLRRFLTSLGYSVSPWKLGLNRGPMMALLDTIKERLQQQGEPTHLVGYSRGGIIAREIARDLPELAKSVITMGTPVQGGLNATSIKRAVQRDTGITPDSVRDLMRSRQSRPIETPITALYSRTDGVVSWRACIDHDSPNIKHIQVSSSHAGMGFHAQVFQLIAQTLADS